MKHSALAAVIARMPAAAVAVSGGVDSMTLAAFMAQARSDVEMFHAVSPAVPKEATDRVLRMAEQHHWKLTIVNAGEFNDPNYRANPVNRCFYCKTNLYGAIATKTDRQLVSGANLDDLGEYRPGLDAAQEHAVRHPYIEASMNKLAVRDLARWLGLPTLAELPSSPCLSSRVETGIRIEAPLLSFIHDVEQLVTKQLQPGTVRCRVRADAIVVELDAETLERIDQDTRAQLKQSIAMQRHVPEGKALRFERYRNGSAFLIHHATL